MFDVAVHLDELRSWPTERLGRERATLVSEQRQLRTRGLAVLRVLDERGHVDCSVGSGGESARVMRDKVETARALESLPQIAAAAFDVALNDEQLSSVVKLADESSDAEWAARAAQVDDIPVAIGKRAPALSPKISRAVLLRDSQCRVPGCARRHGLEVHHLVPRSWGGTDDIANLAVVCASHHRTLVPHGRWALVGNPNLPDGLRLVDAADLPPPRAGPHAA